jgi:hypothetical protein
MPPDKSDAKPEFAGLSRFTFPPRYAGEEERMLDEVMAAFADRSSDGIRS